jgi:hypothetical protein
MVRDKKVVVSLCVFIAPLHPVNAGKRNKRNPALFINFDGVAKIGPNPFAATIT